MFSDTVYILYLPRYGLSLLTMQLQAFSSSLNDYIFLLTAPSAIPSCPFAQNDDVRTVFWSQQTCQKQSVQKSPPLSLAHDMWSTSFHSGSPATLISTLTSHIFFQVNSTTWWFICESHLRHMHRRETPLSCWLNLLIILLQILPPYFCTGPTKTQWTNGWHVVTLPLFMLIDLMLLISMCPTHLGQSIPSFQGLLGRPSQTVICLKSSWKASRRLVT